MCINFALLFILAALATATNSVAVGFPSKCPITEKTTVVYSQVGGVGPASNIWVQDFLWWWRQADPTVEYVALKEADFRNCDLSSFPNLRLYVNPGGDAYMQLYNLGVEGTTNIKNFVSRDQSVAPSAYVGFCAGGYVASHDYIWETVYEGADYYEFANNPPMSLFPHTLEGSVFDINDDQFGDQNGSKFRAVNVSNGQIMLYYGGSTFGYNGVPAYADPTSLDFDVNVEVLAYFSDIYGYNSYNVPVVWKYGSNVLLTSAHPEADNCTEAQDSDCPPEGSLSTETILQNRAWLATYMNQVAQTNFIIPAVPLAPIFDTTPPHTSYPEPRACYSSSKYTSAESTLVFCDDFDEAPGNVPYGLAANFQRNNSDWNYARPWNATYISTWNNGQYYAEPYDGNGYAVAVTMSTTYHYSTIATKPIMLPHVAAQGALMCSSADGSLIIQFAFTGKTVSTGYMAVDYVFGETAEEVSSDSPNWQEVYIAAPLSNDLSVNDGWEVIRLAVTIPLPARTAATEELTKMNVSSPEGDISSAPVADYARVRFRCAAGAAINNFCAVDSVQVSC